MGETIEIRDVNGTPVRVDLYAAIAAIGATLDGVEEWIMAPRADGQYVGVRLLDDSEVPG